MILRQIQKNVKTIYRLGNSVLIKENNNIIINSSVYSTTDSVVYFTANYFIKIFDGKVEIFDEKMNVSIIYENSKIEKYSSNFNILHEKKLFGSRITQKLVKRL